MGPGYRASIKSSKSARRHIISIQRALSTAWARDLTRYFPYPYRCPCLGQRVEEQASSRRHNWKWVARRRQSRGLAGRRSHLARLRSRIGLLAWKNKAGEKAGKDERIEVMSVDGSRRRGLGCLVPCPHLGLPVG